MSVFYHPFGKYGNKGESFLLNDTSDTIIITGTSGMEIYSMVSGQIKSLTTNKIVIASNNCNYSKKTNQTIEITYEGLIVEDDLIVNQSIDTITVIGKLGDYSPNFTISFQANNSPISVAELYKQNINNVPNYEILSKNTLKVYNSVDSIPARDSYAKLIFAQQPTLMGGFSGGLAGIAESQMIEMLRNPQDMTGYSDDGLLATKANKYQSEQGMHINDAWCAAFVSWCANAGNFVGTDTWPIKPICIGCLDMIRSFQSAGNYTKSPMDYTPVPGDLIFFNWDQNYDIDHVGIVYKIIGNKLITIEGNVIKTPEYIENVIHTYLSGTIIESVLNEVCEGKSFKSYVMEKYGVGYINEINYAGVKAYDLGNPVIDCYLHLK